MKYELRLLLSLIAETPLSAKIETQNLNELIDQHFKNDSKESKQLKTFTEPEQTVSKLLQNWKTSFYKKLSKFDNGTDRSVQNNQLALIRLKEMILEKLLNEQNFSSVDPDTIDFFQKLYCQFDELLFNLEKNFPDFIDRGVYVSDFRKRQLFDSALEKRAVILSELKRSDISEDLQAIIELHLNKIYSPKSKERICHKELFYHLHFAEILYKALRDKKKEITEKRILLLLFKLNLNSLKFFNHFTSYIEDEINLIPKLADKLKRYFYHLKRSRQIQLMIRSGYRSKAKSIKTQLEGWLREEINYMKETQLKSQDTTDVSAEKLTMSLSVEGISLYMRAHKEIGLFKNQNHSEILRIVTRTMASSKTNNISFGSLRNKYYNVGESTRKEVKKTLQELLNHVNTMQLV
jgi:hypothetical protein